MPKLSAEDNWRELTLKPKPAVMKDLTKLSLNEKENIKAIILLLQQENKKRELKGEPIKAEVEFYLSDYAEARGYSEKELSEDSLAELKKDLYSGAITTYWFEDAEYKGGKYTAHGLPNFYVLLEPEHKKDKWLVIINELYREMFSAKADEFFYIIRLE